MGATIKTSPTSVLPAGKFLSAKLQAKGSTILFDPSVQSASEVAKGKTGAEDQDPEVGVPSPPVNEETGVDPKPAAATISTSSAQQGVCCCAAAVMPCAFFFFSF